MREEMRRLHGRRILKEGQGESLLQVKGSLTGQHVSTEKFRAFLAARSFNNITRRVKGEHKYRTRAQMFPCRASYASDQVREH